MGNYMNPKATEAPCKTCLVFVMCQSRVQQAIRETLLSRPYDYDYADDDMGSSHKDLIMLTFYLHLAECDMLQDHISNILADRNLLNHNTHVNREAITLDVLYETFKIELTQIIDYQQLIKDNE